MNDETPKVVKEGIVLDAEDRPIRLGDPEGVTGAQVTSAPPKTLGVRVLQTLVILSGAALVFFSLLFVLAIVGIAAIVYFVRSRRFRR